MTPKQARDKRGWTIYEACRRSTISSSSYERLERSPFDAGPTTTVGVLLKLIDLYGGDVNLEDLVPGCDLEVTPAWRVRRDVGLPPA